MNEPEVAYLDLDKDQALFSGDAEEEYQYEIYRYMRSCVYFDEPLVPYEPPEHHELQNQQDSQADAPQQSPKKSPWNAKLKKVGKDDVWRRFYPRTNLLWLHFLLFKLSQGLEFPSASTTTEIVERINLPSSPSIPPSQTQEPSQLDGQAEPEPLKCPFDPKKLHRKAMRLEKILRKVVRALEPGELMGEEGLRSVGELVGWAVGEGWLGEGDISA